MKHRDGILDLVRGTSASLVMLGHLRGLVLLDFGEVAKAGPAAKAFYFATGLGHQAVMVFFVLSGYFVGGSVVSGLPSGRFTWSAYALARLARLWTVLVPALLLTLGLDLLGAHVCPEAYAGGFKDRFMSGPTPEAPAAWGPLAFLGNLFFLQTITAPVYGSNGPLWSLANEFWYYALFPLCACGVAGISRRLRGRAGLPADAAASPVGGGIVAPILMLLVFCGLAYWLPWHLVSAGLIWLLGVVVWWVARHPGTQRLCRNWIWRGGFGLVFLGTLAASKTQHWLGGDLAVGIAFAFWVPSLLGAWPKAGWLSRFSTGLSEVSYTLYVVHFPMLFFAAAVFLRGRQFAPDLTGMAWFAVLAVVCFVLSAGMWWMFERNTDKVKRKTFLVLGSWCP
jgi:peptidoglycan/LPS O-acetylase OafA/YrhL